VLHVTSSPLDNGSAFATGATVTTPSATLAAVDAMPSASVNRVRIIAVSPLWT
jgi:hypothetical protein